MIWGVIISSGDQNVTRFYEEKAKTAGGKEIQYERKLGEEKFIDFLLSSRHSPAHSRRDDDPSVLVERIHALSQFYRAFNTQ